jgi:4-amino-4-deoxy-L-arabinose transferase-like glycosyltransferase
VPEYYVNHPPLVVWVSALALTLFGSDELSLRFVSMASTLIAVAGFYALCARLFGRRRALLCVALFTLTPMILYFGRMPNHEPLALACLLPAAALLFDDRPTARPALRRAASVLLAALAIWTAWAAVFFVGALAVTRWLLRDRRWALVWGAVALITPLAIIGFYITQYPDTLDALRYAWTTRTGNLAQDRFPFTWGDFVVTTLVHLASSATLALLLIGPLGWLLMLRHRRAEGRRRLLVTGALLAAGLAYIILFRQVSFLHDYYKIFLLPALAIGAHYVWVWGWNHRRWRVWLRPALIGLTVPSLMFAAYLMAGYINTNDDHASLRVAAYVAEVTRPEQTIYTNLPFNPNIDYYAQRHMIQGVSQAEAAAQAGANAVYLDCAWVDAERTGVTFDPQQPGAGCTLLPLAAP